MSVTSRLDQQEPVQKQNPRFLVNKKIVARKTATFLIGGQSEDDGGHGDAIRFDYKDGIPHVSDPDYDSFWVRLFFRIYVQYLNFCE